MALPRVGVNCTIRTTILTMPFCLPPLATLPVLRGVRWDNRLFRYGSAHGTLPAQAVNVSVTRPPGTATPRSPQDRTQYPPVSYRHPRRVPAEPYPTARRRAPSESPSPSNAASRIAIAPTAPPHARRSADG